LFCEYAIGSKNGRRTRKELINKRETLVADLLRQARKAKKGAADIAAEPAEVDRHR